MGEKQEESVIKRFRGLVEEIKKANGFIDQQLANAIGYKSKTYISDLKAGRRNVASVLEVLEKKFGANAVWLHTGHGHMFLAGSTGLLTADSGVGEVHRWPQALFVPAHALDEYIHQCKKPRFLKTLLSYDSPPKTEINLHDVTRYFEVPAGKLEKDVLFCCLVKEDNWRLKNAFQMYVLITEMGLLIKYVAWQDQAFVLRAINSPALEEKLESSKVIELWQIKACIGTRLPSDYYPSTI